MNSPWLPMAKQLFRIGVELIVLPSTKRTSTYLGYMHMNGRVQLLHVNMFLVLDRYTMTLLL